MTALTPTEILEARRTWLRDEWNAGTFRGLSHYNVATKASFFDDPALESFHVHVENEYGEELDGLELRKYNERIDYGDGAATAETASEAARLSAVYRLMRAEAFERMVLDPGFRKIFSEDPKTLERMEAQIGKDRDFIRGRAGLRVLRLRRS